MILLYRGTATAKTRLFHARPASDWPTKSTRPAVVSIRFSVASLGSVGQDLELAYAAGWRIRKKQLAQCSYVMGAATKERGSRASFYLCAARHDASETAHTASAELDPSAVQDQAIGPVCCRLRPSESAAA